MKKLMMAVSAVLVAASTFAAASDWKVLGGSLYAGNETDKYSGTAYIFDAGVLAQSALFDEYSKNSSYIADNAKGSVTFASGSPSTTANTFSYGKSGTYYDFYYVVISSDEKAVYFSNVLTGQAAQESPNVGSLKFGGQNNGTTTFSATAAADGFQGAGKWSAVPEPTSGLLMLLGFAGLALRRKQK